MNDNNDLRDEMKKDFERLWKIVGLTEHLYVPFEKRKGANSRDHYQDSNYKEL